MKFSAFIISLITIISCTKNYQFGEVRVGEIFIPDSVKVNDQVKILVKAEATNGCWDIVHVEFMEKDVFEYSIQAFGKFTGCKNCDCNDEMVYKDFEIDFQPKKDGIYFFHIKKSLNKIDVDSIIVY